MPLHDWTDRPGWEGVHHLWITELLRWVKPRLPPGYRAYIGTAPVVAIGSPVEKPDVGVRAWPEEAHQPPASANGASSEPDEEIAVATLDATASLFVEVRGRLAAAVELISPRNKDRATSRAGYLARYVSYLIEGVNLLLVDVHRRPLNFSFAERIAEDLQFRQAPFPTPLAVSYRVGEPAATGGRLLAIWRRPLAVGTALPTIPLPLTTELAVPVDLEQTYLRAAADAYLS
ncbi:MAG: DUF4058 family protein [Planctomycetia bacterium]|nr:DUF4058 family protein [Planctomycetia bacterium]